MNETRRTISRKCQYLQVFPVRPPAPPTVNPLYSRVNWRGLGEASLFPRSGIAGHVVILCWVFWRQGHPGLVCLHRWITDHLGQPGGLEAEFWGGEGWGVE